MDGDLELTIRKVDDVHVVELKGDVDTFTCGKLREAIVNLLKEGNSRLVIRMANVDYIDSSGLGTLVGGLRRVTEQNGGLAISGASPQIQKVLNITGLSKVFTMCESDVEAARTLLG